MERTEKDPMAQRELERSRKRKLIDKNEFRNGQKCKYVNILSININKSCFVPYFRKYCLPMFKSGDRVITVPGYVFCNHQNFKNLL